jgi:deoxyhypusine synthase
MKIGNYINKATMFAWAISLLASPGLNSISAVNISDWTDLEEFLLQALQQILKPEAESIVELHQLLGNKLQQSSGSMIKSRC